MRTLRPLLAVGLTLALACLARADPKPQEAIIGKWEPQEGKGKVTIEFLKGGKLKVTHGTEMIEGTYKFVSDDTVEVTLTIGTDTKTEKLKVKVGDKDMETTDAGGKTEKFTRLK